MREFRTQNLYGRFYEGAKGTVFLLHGLLSSSAEFFDYPERINDVGYSVLSFDFSGHGKSGGARGYEDIAKNLRDIEIWKNFLGKRGLLRKPLILVGHSLGGATVIYALARNMGDAGVAIAPARSIRDLLTPGQRFGFSLLYHLNPLKQAITGKPIYVRYKADYSLLYSDKSAAIKGARAGFLGDKIDIRSYRPLMSVDAGNEARRVKKPCLVIVPSEDKMVPPEEGKRIYELLGGEKEMYVAKGYGHSVMGEDKGDVFQKIMEFIEKIAASSS